MKPKDHFRLDIKNEPDGMGFIYGTAFGPGGEVWRVDIMPPLPHWHGQVHAKGYGPHPTDWVLYVDGDEIARVANAEELPRVAGERLLALGRSRR